MHSLIRVARPYQPGDSLRIRHERWRVVRTDLLDEEVTLDVVGCDSSNAGVRALFLASAERIERLAAIGVPRVLRPAGWRATARRRLASTTARFEALRTLVNADITVLPFQLEPALALTRGLGSRLLVADEVGLGKTIQAGLLIAEALARASEGRALVVAPAGLRQQWLDELRQRFHLAAVALDAATIARAVDARDMRANPWAAHPVIVVSIDYVKRPEVLRALETLVWDVVVFDEVHMLAGFSERAAAAQRLGARARTMVGLTATPHSGDPDAFARLVALGELGSASPLLMFRRTRRDVGLPSRRRSRWLAVRPAAAELEMHQRLLHYARTVCRERQADGGAARLAMSILLKRGCSSATSLVRSLERRRELLAAAATSPAAQQLPLPFPVADDEEPMAVLAAPGLTDRVAEEEMLSSLLVSARHAATGERKIDVLRRLLRRRAEPAIVFTEYRDTLDHIAAQLTGHHIAIVHGGLGTSERQAALRLFTHGTADVLLATDAVSEGLNLHRRCRRVVNVELPWTPVRLEQRLGRVDRIGQTQVVHATHLIARDTVEQRIVSRLLARMSIADAALTGVAARHEDEILSAVTGTGGTLAPTSASARRRTTPVVLPQLRAAAEREAADVLTMRRMATPGDDQLAPRPVITRARRRGRQRRVWAFRLMFSDDGGHVRWSTIIGVALDGPAIAAELRRALDVSVVIDSVNAQLPAISAPLIDGARRFAAHAMTREDELLSALEATRARLLPPAPGLFDRHNERASAAQFQILADATSRCERHRRQLTHLQRLTLTVCELAFAAAIE